MHKKGCGTSKQKIPLYFLFVANRDKLGQRIVCVLMLARAQLLSLTSQLEALHPQIKDIHEGNGVKMMITSNCL